MHRIWFVLGISGAGKSHFSRSAAERLSWFHYEIDRTPHDGIDHWGLRFEWDAYLNQNDIGPLASTIRGRSCRQECTGSILSFPGNLLGVLTEAHVRAAQRETKVVVLAGPREACRNAFLRREVEAGSGLSGSHWDTNNENLYEAILRPWIAPLVHNVFETNGERKPFEELLNIVHAAG